MDEPITQKTRFDLRLEGLSSEIWSQLRHIDELKGQWIAGAKLSPQILGRLKRSTLVTSTGASTRIEGAKLSDENIEKMMRGIGIQKFTDRDTQEVQGYYELLENVFNSWRGIPFSESSIKHLHRELLKYVEKDERHRGDWKKGENTVHMVNEAGESVAILFNTTPAWQTPKEMQELIEWTQKALAEKKYHPVISIGNFLVEFLNIHPFQDGNGRLSRVLANLLLLKEGYAYIPYVSHEKLVEENKPEYYVALRRSQKTFRSEHEDVTPWLDFFFGVLLKQAQIAVDLLSKENIEKNLSPKQRAVWEYLQTVDSATPGEISRAANVARRTVNQAFDSLLRLKKVERTGLGRTTRYKKL